MKSQDNSEHKEADNRSGCKGCLLTMFLIIIVPTLIIIIHDYRYRKNPTPAYREIVEGMTGVNFPPYKVIDIDRKTGIDYSDDITLEFKEIPDSSFFAKIEAMCDTVPGLGNPEEYQLWNQNGKRYQFRFSAYKPQKQYDSIRNVFVSRGVPRDYVFERDLFYYVTITQDSLKWTITAGEM